MKHKWKRMLGYAVSLSMIFSLGSAWLMPVLAQEETQEEETTGQETQNPENQDNEGVEGETPEEVTEDPAEEEVTETETETEVDTQSDEEENEEDQVENPVAQIGDEQYETLDEAVEKAPEVSTIELLADCTSEGMDISNKNLTFTKSASFQGTPTITFNQLGIHSSGSILTFLDCNVNMTVSDNTSHSGGTSNLIDNSTLCLNGSNWQIINDHSDASGESGLYLYNGSNLYIRNGSSMNVSGYNDTAEDSGIYSDGSEHGDTSFDIEVSGASTLTVTDCGWGGMTVNPCDVLIQGNSSINISNCGLNGGKQGFGCYYGKLTIVDHSVLDVSNNVGTDWGIFIKDVEVDGTSKIDASNNTGDGIDIGGTAIFKSGAKLTASNNTSTGIRVYVSGDTWAGNVTVENQSVVTANGNGGYGFRNNNVLNIQSRAEMTLNENALAGLGNNQATAQCTIGKDASVTILRNKNGGVYNVGNLVMNAGTIMFNNRSEGGGVNNGGSASLSEDVVLYNNHASSAGDDIYNSNENASITFADISYANNWALDGEPDCTDAIGGWYKDEANTRWNAHPQEGEEYAVEQYHPQDTAYTGVLALKAAHGIQKYTITINYIDEDTGKNISQSVFKDYLEGSAYDVSQHDAIDIPGYTYVRTDGDPTQADHIEKDVVINVYYKKNASTTPEDTKDPGKDSGTTTKGENTGLSMSLPLAGAFGTMSVALLGMIALVRRKK